MSPAIWPGDLLTFEPIRIEQVKRGDVVLFRAEGPSSSESGGQRLTAHRVVDLDSSCLVTRGDALEACDPPVQASALLGSLVAVKPNHWRRFRGRVSLVVRRLRPAALRGPSIGSAHG